MDVFRFSFWITGFAENFVLQKQDKSAWQPIAGGDGGGDEGWSAGSVAAVDGLRIFESRANGGVPIPLHTTVDGQNPAPPRMIFIPSFIRLRF